MEKAKTYYYWSKITPRCKDPLRNGVGHKWGHADGDMDEMYRCLRCGAIRLALADSQKVSVVVSRGEEA